MESEQTTPVCLIKNVVQRSVYPPEFYKKHLKNAGRYIGANVVNIKKERQWSENPV